ncbi:MAG TPA: RNA polymerase sigma factor [Thermoleophilaceae bacterium]|nr:RNA polymerase sigma factor [Thermoleophilaceae bacterium]
MERQLDPNSLGDHLDRLYSVALTLCGAREPAEDLVQETYARVLARPRLLRGDDDLAYLVRVLRNTWISQGRSAARRPATRPLPDDPEVLPGAASLEPQARLEADRVRHAILALPEQLRDVLLVVDVGGLSYRDAGRALRIREATVTGRLHRARKAVMRDLESHEPAPQALGADPGSVGAVGATGEGQTG